MNEAEFANHIEMQEYAERNGLDYTWSGTALYAKRKRIAAGQSVRGAGGADQAGHHHGRAFLGIHHQGRAEGRRAVSGGHGGEAAGPNGAGIATSGGLRSG
jgi:hypothetical protein